MADKHMKDAQHHSLFSSVQFSLSVMSDSATPWTAACWASLSITNSQSLLKHMSIESVMPSNHLLLCHPLLHPHLVFPSISQSVSQFSCSVVSDSLWPHEPQHARLPCPSPIPRVYPNSGPLSQWCHQPSHPLLSPPPPAFNLLQNKGLFKWVSCSHQVVKILEFQLQHKSFQWTPRTDFL